MFRQLLGVVSLLCMPQIASAGTVVFDPPQAQVLPGEAVTFDVWVSETSLSRWDTVSVLIGSDAEIGMAMTVNLEICPDLSDCNVGPLPLGVYVTDLVVGGNNFGGWTSPFWLGELRVDMPADAAGIYELLVSSEEEQRRIGGAISAIQSGTQPAEPLEGRLTIRVIPDPAAVLLLGVGMLSLGMFLRRVPQGGQKCSGISSA